MHNYLNILITKRKTSGIYYIEMTGSYTSGQLIIAVYTELL